MEYKKVTITLPLEMYIGVMKVVERGYYSNISDLIRSGIRTELKNAARIKENMESL